MQENKKRVLLIEVVNKAFKYFVPYKNVVSAVIKFSRNKKF